MVRADQHPSIAARAIRRPRLLDRLEQRFDVPLTLVLGGGGSGKTTLLAQALTDAPDRLDVWVTAVEADDLDRLVARLLAGLGRGGDTPTLDGLAEAVVAQSPRHVCLCVDDAHRLTSDAPLSAVLEALPRNGHLLVASRRRPQLGPAGDRGVRTLEIDQSELLMTDAELVEFAGRCGVDVDRLAGAEGWPAFVELATTGDEGTSRQYLEEDAVRNLSAERLAALARFAYVGGGDDEVCRAATGWPLGEVVEGLPLVVGDVGAVMRPHDLWLELIGGQLADADRLDAAVAAASVRAGRGEYDEAIELTGRAGATAELLGHIRQACIEILDGGLRADRLGRWRALVPSGADDEPEAHFIRGLSQREQDPTSAACWSELEAAAAGFRSRGDHQAELAVLAQLGYITRLRADTEALGELMERVAELAEAGIGEAHSFLAFGEAWEAMARADRTAQLAAMERLGDVELSPVWRRTRDHLWANALMALGRAEEGLEIVPTDLGDAEAGLPGALVTEDQCLWHSGHPEEVVARGVKGLGPEFGARDRYVGGTFAAMVYGFAGRTDEANAAIRVAREALGEEPGLFLEIQLGLVERIATISAGNEDELRDMLRFLFDRAPLGMGVTENLLGLHCALPYVLCPETREWWDSASLPPGTGDVLTMGQVMAAFRDDGDLAPTRRFSWPPAGKVFAALPVNWGIELGLMGVLAGAPPAHGVVAWACENWGSPAREALRRFASGNGPLAAPAATLMVELPTPPDMPVQLSVLGPMELRHGGHPTADTNWRRERVRALLLYLALHRGLVPRERVAEELWPDLDGAKADKNLRTTLSYLHGVLEPGRESREASFCVRNENGMLSLHRSTEVDLWRFDALIDEAVDLERAGTPSRALARLLDAVALWRGDLAAGEADHGWADLERTRVRSRFVRAATRAGELLAATRRPEEAISVCHAAIEADRWHEPAYAALARAYVDLGDLTSARSTVKSAEKALAGLGLELSSELGRLLEQS